MGEIITESENLKLLGGTIDSGLNLKNTSTASARSFKKASQT